MISPKIMHFFAYHPLHSCWTRSDWLWRSSGSGELCGERYHLRPRGSKWVKSLDLENSAGTGGWTVDCRQELWMMFPLLFRCFRNPGELQILSCVVESVCLLEEFGIHNLPSLHFWGAGQQKNIFLLVSLLNPMVVFTCKPTFLTPQTMRRAICLLLLFVSAREPRNRCRHVHQT